MPRHTAIAIPLVALTLCVAALPGCRSRNAPADPLAAEQPPAEASPGPLARLFKKKPPPPRHDQLDSARYLGSGAAAPRESGARAAAPGLPDVALLQAETLEPPAPEGSAAITDDRWRPEWWLNQPVREAGVVSVCALGDATDLLAARRAAMEQARDLLKRELGGARPPDAPNARATSVRMPDKRFRAFVRLSAPIK